MSKKFSFIGAGKMASAIVLGILESKFAQASEIECISGNDDTAEILAKKTNISVAGDANSLSGEVMVLACKPQQLAEAAQSFGDKAPKLLISILAGATISRLRSAFPKVENIVRVMPNMPALIGKGISCFAAEKILQDDQKILIEGLLKSIGKVIECKESELDAVTALSGSGPGYIFEFAAAMIAAAIKLGFSPEDAKTLTIETFAGSSLLMQAQNANPEELRNAVSSPGGTTLAGLAVFEKANFRKTFEDALSAAKNRAEELSRL